MLTRYELNADIIPDLQEQLADGNSYADTLLKTGYLGSVFTYLPVSIHPYRYELSQLVESGQTSDAPSNSRKAIYDYVYSFLQSSKNGVALIETYYHPKDISKLREIPRIISSGEEIYFFLNKEDELSSIISGFRSARDYPFVCGLIDMEDKEQVFHTKNEISTNQWTIIASKTHVVIIGAYDAVGYLIWEKTL
jgi:hypothetical protein